jgi:hypothetical protein
MRAERGWLVVDEDGPVRVARRHWCPVGVRNRELSERDV